MHAAPFEIQAAVAGRLGVGAWVRGCVGAWVRGCVGAWLRGCVHG